MIVCYYILLSSPINRKSSFKIFYNVTANHSASAVLESQYLMHTLYIRHNDCKTLVASVGAVLGIQYLMHTLYIRRTDCKILVASEGAVLEIQCLMHTLYIRHNDCKTLVAV